MTLNFKQRNGIIYTDIFKLSYRNKFIMYIIPSILTPLFDFIFQFFHIHCRCYSYVKS